MRAGFKRRQFWLNLAWRDVRRRFSRTFIGPFWIVLIHASLILGLAVVYSGVFGVDLKTYVPYLALGLTFWGAMQGIIAEGTEVFVRMSGMMKQVRIPLTAIVLRVLMRAFITLLIQFTVVAVLLIVAGVSPGLMSLFYAFLGTALLFFTGFWLVLILGILSARFNDIIPFMSAVMRFSFLVTPVFWQTGQVGRDSPIVFVNPFYHYLEITRGYFLGADVKPLSWYFAFGCLLVSCVLALFLMKTFARRIPYWV